MDSGFKDWKASNLPNLTGKTYLITGGNSGIGYEAAKHLANAGGDIILACRNEARGEAAITKLKAETGTRAEFLQLDLGDLASVKAAAVLMHEKHTRLDALINNAGVMQPPKGQTKDGFELQFGINHLGHFLFTALMLDMVEAASGRIVTLSSIAHKFGKINFDDIMYDKKYSPSEAYSQSKGANLMFAIELQRRLTKANSAASSIACHPGYSETKLQSSGPTGMFNFLYKITNPLFAQAPNLGALPTILAAAGLEAKAGGYYGPQKMGDTRGPVSDAKVYNYIMDEADAIRLWELSENLVDHEFNIGK